LEKKIEISEKMKKIAKEKYNKLCTFVPEINISNLNILKEYYTNRNNIDKKINIVLLF
jgi:ribosome-associated translation inhibitor RaiA